MLKPFFISSVLSYSYILSMGQDISIGIVQYLNQCIVSVYGFVFLYYVLFAKLLDSSLLGGNIYMYTHSDNFVFSCSTSSFVCTIKFYINIVFIEILPFVPFELVWFHNMICGMKFTIHQFEWNYFVAILWDDDLSSMTGNAKLDFVKFEFVTFVQ